MRQNGHTRGCLPAYCLSVQVEDGGATTSRAVPAGGHIEPQPGRRLPSP